MTSYSSTPSSVAARVGSSLVIAAILVHPTSARADETPPTPPAAPAPAAATDPVAAPSVPAPADTPPPAIVPSPAPSPAQAPAPAPTAPPVSPVTDAPPSPLRSAQWQLGGSFSGSTYSVSPATSSTAVDGNTFKGALGATYYLTPVFDAPAPRTLLPYLQRTSSIRVYGSLGGDEWQRTSGGTNRIQATRLPDSVSSAGVGAEADVYVIPDLAIEGRLGYSQTTSTTLVLPRRFGSAGLGIGYRAGDNRLNLSYDHELAVLGGNTQTLRFGTLTLSDYVVIDRTSLNFFGSLVYGGAIGGAGIGYYPIDDLGITANGYGGFYKAGYGTFLPQYTTVGAGASVTYWVARPVRVGVGYRLGAAIGPADSEPLETTLDHAFDIGILVRL